MATEIYLAMTAAEFVSVTPLPLKAAWMACRFSPDGPGLWGVPSALPPGSLLILTDEVPLGDHDSGLILRQLRQAVELLRCDGVLLDFQQPGIPGLQALAAQLTAALPCPVAVSDAYAGQLGCPVFLSPCPHHMPLSEHLTPWKGRDIWLDLAADREMITLTKDGAVIRPLPPGDLPEGGHGDRKLHCHYRTDTGADFARFTLWRTQGDLEALAQEAEALGIKKLVGLYQELRVESEE